MNQKQVFTPKILMISNQETTTGFLTSFSLQQQKYAVVVEQVAANALERWAEVIPDLIIIDINFPKNLITQLVRALREMTMAPILVLTRGMTEDDLMEVYESGVDDCLVKPIPPSIFLAKIRAWLRHSRIAPAHSLDPLKVGSVHLLPDGRTVTIAGSEPIKLTNLELNLLYSLMSRPKHVVTADELVRDVWGEDFAGDPVMLKNLVYRLRRKIEQKAEGYMLIRTMAGEGYMFIPQ